MTFEIRLPAPCECGHIMAVHTAYLRPEDNHCHDKCACQEYVERTEVVAEPTVKTVDIEPHWPSLARWWCQAMAQHSFEWGERGPVKSFIEIIRYLALSDPEELETIIQELREDK